MCASLQRKHIGCLSTDLTAERDAVLHSKDQLVVGVDDNLRATCSPDTFLIGIKFRQNLFVRPVDPGLEVIAGVAGPIATGAKAIVATGPDRMLVIIGYAAAWVTPPNRLALRIDQPSKTSLRKGG